MTPAEAAAHGVFDETLLEQAIVDGTPKVIALSAIDVNLIIAPTLRQAPSTTPFVPLPLNALPALAQHYSLKAQLENYGQFQGDTLYIFVRTH